MIRIAFFLTLIFPGLLSAAPPDLFSGLKPKLDVVVEELSQEAMSNGLQKADIQSLFERRLKSSGFEVQPDSDTYIAITVKSIGVPRGFSSFYLIELKETAKLVMREPVKQQYGVTWSKSGILVSSSKDMKKHISSKLLEGVNEFIREAKRSK